jgi:uncharacterized Zn finger protein (UPF0148 family)
MHTWDCGCKAYGYGIAVWTNDGRVVCPECKANEDEIDAFHAAVDAEAADERRDEALWQAEEARIEQEREMERRGQPFTRYRTDEGEDDG